MTDKTNDAAGGALAARPAPAAPPKDQKPPRREEDRPVRRVGSFTLGLCLIAVGVCFLCYYFIPGFAWLPVVKVGAPLALVALGIETIWCAAHVGRWKYDFLAVLGCLVLMGGAFCLTLAPLFWQEVDPERRIRLYALTDRYEEELYGALDGRLRLRTLDVYADADFGAETPQMLEDLGRGDVRFYVRADPYGPYDESRDGDENVARFAADCWTVTQAVLRQGPIPDRVSFSWQSPDGTWGFDLDLSSRVQLDWTADQMAEQTRVWATETFDGVENMDSHLDEMLSHAS